MASRNGVRQGKQEKSPIYTHNANYYFMTQQELLVSAVCKHTKCNYNLFNFESTFLGNKMKIKQFSIS